MIFNSYALLYALQNVLPINEGFAKLHLRLTEKRGVIRIMGLRSIEEQIEDIAKRQLSAMKYYTKTEIINEEIEKALKIAPSKNGGNGMNYPDIKLFVQTKDLRYIPVMIEVKGKKGDLVKFDANGEIENFKKDGSSNFTNIKKYAVNGAIHYADAIVKNTSSYKDVVAIGINGYYEGDNLIYELGVYYVSQKNYCIPKKVGDYSDLSFLSKENINEFICAIDDLGLSTEEIELKSKEFENEIEKKLKTLNQIMQDTLKISVGSRVELVAGMIMAGLGVEEKVAPLEISELKGEKGSKSNDGRVIINKIDSFLNERNLPQEKKDMIINDLSRVFIYSDLWKPINGESKIKSVYAIVKKDIMPIFTSAKHLDFTGKLFNVLNEWVDIPDSDKNDVVLTPRYVTELMAKLAQVDMNSYVWDYATGSAGFLVSSMKLMIQDAQERIKSPNLLNDKLIKIKTEQLLGIEKRSDIYLLAVLNMILMGDGSSNIVHKDSLTEYEGKYEQGKLKGTDFPANVFLLNPPYSAEGKGLIFVEKALKKMKSGKAAVLIHESSGNGKGLPYTKRILKDNTLLASIHMSDIFKGKASVRTAIYVFDIGIPHNEKQVVKFIDFSNDGYFRQNRRKASMEVNLQDVDHAQERYEEIVNLVLYGKSYLHYYSEKEYIEDTISLNGDDWTFSQHIKPNTKPELKDFERDLRNYFGWKTATIFKGIINDKLDITTRRDYVLTNEEKEAIKRYQEDKVLYGEFNVGKDLFDIHPTKSYGLTNRLLFKEAGEVPVVVNSSLENGIGGYVSLKPTEKGNMITYSDTTTTEGIFYQPYDFIGYSHVQGLYPLNDVNWTENALLYFVTLFRKGAENRFDYVIKFNRDNAKAMDVKLPIKVNGEIDFEFIECFVEAQKKTIIYEALK